jgi:dCTP deaminase
MSIEEFGSDIYLTHLSGKSSLARLGLVVHNTAGLINPGHFLHITFELANMGSIPIILRPGMEIAQILFSELSSPIERNYQETGRYKDGRDNFTSYIHKE